VGAAARSLETLTSDALLDRADQALLIAKRTGRNRVVRHDEMEHSLSLMCENGDPDAEKDRARVDSAALIPFHIVNTLLTALKYRDPSTVSHSQRVARLCRQFGQQLGLPPAERLTMEFAALLHDAGKLATPDELLTKTGKLTEEEFAEVQKHRQVTVELMSSCFSNPRLVEIVKLSDRWYDGSHGDPRGKKIPQGSRILAIISLFDDMTHGRAWWERQSIQDALDKIENLSGSQLDPELTSKFVAMVRNSEAPAELCV
jgi:HD-GYP domain-containing protein (c-di-GMP phosphodiesterase class II)